MTLLKRRDTGTTSYLDVEHPYVEVVMGDFVDRIVEQWQQERPDLDLGPTEIVGRIDRLAVHLRRSIDETLAGFGLHRGGFAVLAALRRSGHPYRLHPTELFTGLLSSSGAMTNRLDRLESDGLIRRVPDPADRRSVLVELTSAGKTLSEDAAEAHLANERRLLEPLTAGEQQQLATLLRTLLVAFEDQPPHARTEETDSPQQ